MATVVEISSSKRKRKASINNSDATGVTGVTGVTGPSEQNDKAEDKPVEIKVVPPQKETDDSSSDSSIDKNNKSSRRPSRTGYIKTVVRRGNTYLLKESLPSEEDPAELDSTRVMIDDLYRDTIRLSSHATKQSTIFKTMYVLSDLFIVVAGVVIAVLSYSSGSYYGATLGAIVSAIQTILTTFSIEKRGVLLRDVANKLRHVSRQIRNLQNSDLKPKAKLKELEKYYDQVDELDLSIFDNNITISSKNDDTSTRPIKQDDSDVESSDDWYESHAARKSLRKRTPIIAKLVVDDTSVISAMKKETVPETK